MISFNVKYAHKIEHLGIGFPFLVSAYVFNLQIIFSIGEVAEKFISGVFGDLWRAFGHSQITEVLQE